MNAPTLLNLDTLPPELAPHFAGLSCLLCGSKSPAFHAAFAPNKPGDYGIPTDQAALLLYVLCLKCFDLPDRDALTDLALRPTKGEAS